MVKGFAHFQHYRDRSPVWIKLYNAVMDDEAFLALPDAARGHLILIWLLASRRDNKLPHDAKAIARAIQSSGRVDLEKLIAAGFLLPYDPASSLLAEPEQDASDVLAKPEQTASVMLSRAGPRAPVRSRRGREEGERETTSPPPAAANGTHAPEVPPVEPPAGGNLEAFPKSTCDAVYEAWLATLGAVDYGRLRKALLPLYKSRTTPHPTAEQLTQAVAAFLDARDADDPKFRGKYTPEMFAGQLHDYVRMGGQPYLDEWGEATERGRMARILA